MSRHVIFHQFDPTQHVAGGIPGYVYDLVRYAPAPHTFSVVGVTSSRRRKLGRWQDISIGGKSVAFMPVARLDPANQARRVPHSARFLAGTLRYHPNHDHALVHSHRAEVGAVLSVLSPRDSRVQFIHGDGQEALRHRSETFWRWLPSGYMAAEAFAVRRASRTIVMSRAATKRLTEHSPNAILGRNWFDGRCFHPASDVESVEGLRIGWVGRLEPPKDPLRAVAVLRALANLGVTFSAWMAGTGTLADRVRRALQDADLSGRVELMGLLRPTELADELRRSTACLMTSTWEGFPRSAVEALACGIPLVSTDVGELTTFVRSGVNGYLVQESEASTLAHRLVESKQLQRGRPIADTVEHLEARKVVRELFNELDSIEIAKNRRA